MGLNYYPCYPHNVSVTDNFICKVTKFSGIATHITAKAQGNRIKI